MGIKDVVGKALGFEMWPEPGDIADLAVAGEHAERALRHARQEVPGCEDIEVALVRMGWFGARLEALEQRRQKAASKGEEATARAVMLPLDLCFQGWTQQYESLYLDALRRGHGRNFAHARAVKEKRQRGLFPKSGNEAA